MWWVISRLRSTSDKYITVFVNHTGDCQCAYRTTERIFQKNASQFLCWERDSKCTGKNSRQGGKNMHRARRTLNSPCNVPNSKNVFFNWRELSLWYRQITCFSSINFFLALLDSPPKSVTKSIHPKSISSLEPSWAFLQLIAHALVGPLLLSRDHCLHPVRLQISVSKINKTSAR